MPATSRRILFCTEHCLADSGSGAAISALEMLAGLRDHDWDPHVLCGPLMDGLVTHPVGSRIETLALPGDRAAELAVHHVEAMGVPVRIAGATPETGSPELRTATLISLLRLELERARPDLLLTYGGGWASRAILLAAKAAGVPTAFWLRNGLYNRRDLFALVTAGVVVPSLWASKHYRQALDLRTEVIYPTVSRERVHCYVRRPTCLTFVSPLPEKGVFFMARLVSELARVRPDIDVLLVEGRGDLAWFDKSGLSVLDLPTVRVLRGRVADPKTFLARTRALVMPAAWDEAFGRTALEAMISGIPVIASNRGALPETVGQGGIILPVPDRVSAGMPLLATPGEVGPWLRDIEHLWDDEDDYRALARTAVASAARFDPGVMTAHASEVFEAWSETLVAPQAMTLAEILQQSGYPTDIEERAETWERVEEEGARLLK